MKKVYAQRPAPVLAIASIASVMASLLTYAAPAQAVKEPNGLTIPQPLNGDLPFETSAGSLTLQSLFASRGEQIDWVTDALTSPAVFSPLCAFTGTLVLRGGGCKVDFGWYNADNSGNPPPDAEIYTLVPKTDPIFDQTFRPQVGQTGQTFSAADIQNNPNYKGGLIGFAVKGSPGTDCTQTHYSQQELNILCTNCSPPDHWITTLIYKSTVTPNAFYVAFEDLPMSPTDFGGFPGQQYKNDGDFNDFVYFLTGIDCEGAGQPCETGLLGVCANGLTSCSTDGKVDCQPQVPPSAEKCDGIDNDCDGTVDQAEKICGADQVCDKGTCVGACLGAEFPCKGDLVCNSQGFCVDQACQSVTCPAGEICSKGQCKGPCGGVVCPKGQTCQVGKCVDPCASVTCKNGSVCQDGFCLIACGCKGCLSAASECDAKSGQCVDQGCADKGCGAGMVCIAGSCVDACEGAVCPGGAACSNGQCEEPTSETGAGGASSGGFPGTGGSFVGAGGSDTGSGTSNGSGASGGGSGGAGGNGTKPPPQDAGCACDVAGAPSDGLAAGIPGLLLLLGLLRRKRAGSA